MRKENRTYYFSVEGETEKWYLDWLQRAINEDPASRYTVKLLSKIQKDPLSYAKSLTFIGKAEVTHIFDRESEDALHTAQFRETLDRMKQAQSIGKNLRYVLGYSNFTFELWMILHKADCNGPKADRRQYLEPLNKAYGERFEDLENYKREANFHRLLSRLTLDNVRDAVRRAEKITQQNASAGFAEQHYKGYSYYRENPSLSVWVTVKKVLTECGLG